MSVARAAGRKRCLRRQLRPRRPGEGRRARALSEVRPVLLVAIVAAGAVHGLLAGPGRLVLLGFLAMLAVAALAAMDTEDGARCRRWWRRIRRRRVPLSVPRRSPSSDAP